MKRLAILVSAMFVGIGALTLAAAQGSSSNPTQPVAITDARAADVLARSILYPRDLDDDAVSEEFARAGMATVSMLGTMRHGMAPTIPEVDPVVRTVRALAEGAFTSMAWR